MIQGNFFKKTKIINYFLHGFCDLFIMELFNYFNGDIPIGIVFDNEGELIHCFLITDDNYFIDVRGITDNVNTFFKEFLEDDEIQFLIDTNFDTEQIGICQLKVFYSLDNYLEFVEKHFDDSEYYKQYDILEKAKSYIKEYSFFYN